MSQSSPRHLSHETTGSGNGEFAPVNQPSSRQSPEPEEAEREPGQADTAAEAQPAPKQPNEATEQVSASAAEKKDSQARRKSKLKGGSTKEYRILFNAVISNARHGTCEDLESLVPSRIGASYWSSEEKDAFFTELVRCGPGDLHALSVATRTRSEAEVQVYLGLLQEGFVEMNITLPRQDGFSLTSIPAAFEIGAECESELDYFADILGEQLEDRDIQVEKEKHGDYWLIDQACAERIEQLAAQDGTPSSQQEPESKVDTADEEHSSPAIGVPFPSTDLLRPEAFLQLSRSLFMNSVAVTEATWHDLAPAGSDGIDGPAIFCTALDDFYNLAVSLTRRLIEATLFQAMSRLRATDASRSNWQPKAEVTQTDVRTTLEMLNMKADGMTYWAKLPRRCELEVYSDSKKYHDGRPGTKNGVKLTYEEVETELGLRSMKEATNADELDSYDADAGHMDEWELDSDVFTLASESEDASFSNSGGEESDRGSQIESSQPILTPESPVEDGVEDEVTKVEASSDGEKADTKLSRKRKQSLSPRSYSRAEEQYLDMLDQQASVQEERRLWQALRLSPPEHLNRNRVEVPAPPVLVRRNGVEAVFNWRRRTRPEAEWERFDETVADQAFARMETEGRRGRKRRKVLHENLRRRSLTGEQSEDSRNESEIEQSSGVDEADEEADEESDM